MTDKVKLTLMTLQDCIDFVVFVGGFVIEFFLFTFLSSPQA